MTTNTPVMLELQMRRPLLRPAFFGSATSFFFLFSLACADHGEPGKAGALVAPDLDGDGFSAEEDCNDSNALVSPAESERCDGVDNNCDGLVDDATSTDGLTWFIDADGDGYGDDSLTTTACSAPAGALATGGDCDDTNAQVHPGGVEVCDGLDDDCDGVVDPDSAEDAPIWYLDVDGDGAGGQDAVQSCSQPEGSSTSALDCDDTDADNFPGNPERCDGLDQDCDLEVDEEAIDTLSWWPDADRDGFGDSAAEVELACEGPSASAVNTDGDCDDSNSDIYPGALELCNTVDDDCDSSTGEEGLATFYDSDNNPTDMTSLLSGTVNLSTAGTLNLCEGTWDLHGDVTATTTIRGLSGSPNTVILSGGGSSSILDYTLVGTENKSTLQDLTLKDGMSSSSTMGGAITCREGVWLDLNNVLIQDSTATLGGAIYADGCTLSITDSTIQDNSAGTHGGAFYLLDSTVSISGADISGSSAGVIGGSIFSDQSNITFDGSSISESTLSSTAATVLGGGTALYVEAGTFSCTSSSGLGQGLFSNEDTYGGLAAVLVGQDGTFSATACNLGESGTTTDNSPYDIEGIESGYLYRYGDNTTVSCTDFRCGSTTSTTVGAADTSVGSASLLRGNVFEATSEGTLESMSVYLKSSTSTGCDVDFYLLSAASTSDTTWEVEWTDTKLVNHTTAAFEQSDTIGIPVEVGRYYAMVFGWECSTGKLQYSYESSAASIPMGTQVGMWSELYTSYGSTAPSAFDSTTKAFYTKLSSSH